MFLAIKKTIIVTCVLLGSAPAIAQWGIAFGSGQGVHDIKPYRLALSWDFGPVWRKQENWGLNIIWETSFSVWNGPERADLAPNRITDLTAFTTGPMLRWQKQASQKNSWLPYSELGVGLSWLSETEIEGRVLSLHFQFEDKFGLGVRFGKQQQYDLALRAYHYSNCSIKRPNSGVNLAMINLGIWF